MATGGSVISSQVTFLPCLDNCTSLNAFALLLANRTSTMMKIVDNRTNTAARLREGPKIRIPGSMDSDSYSKINNDY